MYSINHVDCQRKRILLYLIISFFWMLFHSFKSISVLFIRRNKIVDGFIQIEMNVTRYALTLKT